jgi:hypothetical protein
MCENSDMAIAGGEFVLKLSTAFSMRKCFHMRLYSVAKCTVFVTVFANLACAEIVSLQLQTRPVQAAEALLTLLPSLCAFSPNYIRKLAGRGFLSVERLTKKGTQIS